MKLRGFSILLLLLVFALSFTACEKSGEKMADASDKQATVNSMPASNLPAAYAFELVTLSGQPISLDDYKGKVLILDFWDTWCPPCKAEIPHFVELYDQYNSQGLEILGVAFGRNGVPAVKQFIQDYNVNYENAIGNQQIVSGFGGFNSIPTTFVINQQGQIFKKYTGYRDKAVFEADVKALLMNS